MKVIFIFWNSRSRLEQVTHEGILKDCNCFAIEQFLLWENMLICGPESHLSFLSSCQQEVDESLLARDIIGAGKCRDGCVTRWSGFVPWRDSAVVTPVKLRAQILELLGLSESPSVR